MKLSRSDLKKIILEEIRNILVREQQTDTDEELADLKRREADLLARKADEEAEEARNAKARASAAQRNIATSQSQMAESDVDESIKKVGKSKWAVYPKKGGKRLGTHSTKKAAKKQLAAIEISKSGR